MRVTLKVLPPFTGGLQTAEGEYLLPDGARLIDLLKVAEGEGVIKLSTVVGEGGEVRDGVIVLVNGRAVYRLDHTLRDGDRVVVLPLAPGG